MSISEQADYLFKYGEFIADRHHLGSKRLLYLLSEKFYEIIYLPHENVIEEIKLRQVPYIAEYYGDSITLDL